MVDNPLTRPDAIELVKLGKTTITLGGVAAAIVIVVASIYLSRLVTSGLRRLRERSVAGAPSLYIVERLSTYGLRTIGLLMALSVMGVNLTSLAVFAGALGVGAGLGLQGLVKDFASGISLMFERLVAVGDFVELQNGARGVVHEIGPRSTRLRTNDSTDVIVPNSVLVNEQVINWTLHHTTRRIHVPFVTAFGVDKEKVREAVLQAAHSVSFTAPDDANRKAQVWLVGYGESALKFELDRLAHGRSRAASGGDLRGLYLGDRRRPARGGDRGAVPATRRAPARAVRRGGRRRPRRPAPGNPRRPQGQGQGRALEERRRRGPQARGPRGAAAAGPGPAGEGVTLPRASVLTPPPRRAHHLATAK